MVSELKRMMDMPWVTPLWDTVIRLDRMPGASGLCSILKLCQS